MNLEQQVCSLELAKQLKELGIKQESLYGWSLAISKLKHNEVVLTCAQAITHHLYNCHLQKDTYISAFTVAELLNLMPNRITTIHGEPYNSFTFCMNKSFVIKGMDKAETLQKEDNYIINYYCDTASQETSWLYYSMCKCQSDANPANALAKMLTYLIENKLMELPK